MLYYVASPYSKYARGIESAFQDVSKACADLMRQGVAVYSPIAHTHPIAIYGEIDPLDHSIWMPLDHHMMKAADGCIVMMMPGWEGSYGVGIEIETFEKAGKPVRWFSWPELVEVEDPRVKAAA